MKKFFTLILCLTTAFSVFSKEEENLERLFVQANQQYASGNFEEAARLYNSILSAGYFSADLHYNLGNAYYKMDSIPKAILNYEKALRLNPGMEDAEHNLEMANLRTIDKIEPIPDFFLSKWWKSILNIFHPDSWAKWAVVSMFMAFLAIVAYLFAEITAIRKIGFYLAIIAFVFSVVFWFLGSEKYSYLQNSTEAIVMTPTINVFSSPTEGSTKLFVLHKGTKVDLEDRKDDWIKIRIPNGNEGWMKAEDADEI